MSFYQVREGKTNRIAIPTYIPYVMGGSEATEAVLCKFAFRFHCSCGEKIRFLFY